MDRLNDAAPEGVVSGFVAHLGRALRCWRADPRLPFVALVIAGVSVAGSALSFAIDESGYQFIGAVVSFATLGFLGTIRLWYLAIEADERPTRDSLVDDSKRLWGRFFRLGVLITLVALVPTGIASNVRSHNEVLGTVLLVAVWVGLDVLLTFAPAALACYDISARRALAYSWQITKAQWPASAPYALAVPLALTVTFAFFPADAMPVVLYVVTALVIAVAALLCKGATVLFYADRYFAPEPRSPRDRSRARRRRRRPKELPPAGAITAS